MQLRGTVPRRTTVALVAVAVIGAGCRGRSSETARDPDDRPSILLVTIESLRPDHVGCYGGPRDTTPALDALAREAILFENCFSVTSWTLAAHASLFTGLYPTAANVVLPRDSLPPAYPTMAELLAGDGYDTAAVVSGPYLRRSFKLDQGFAHYDDEAVSPAGTPAIDDVTNPRMEAKLTAQLEKLAGGGRPFFLFAYFWDPHYDYIPPPPYNTMFVPPGAQPVDIKHYDGGQNPVRRGMPQAQLDYVIAQYDGEIRSTDDALGRVFETMKRLGLWERTAIIVTSDHGEEFFEHGGKGHKNNLYVESVHVPLWIKPARMNVQQSAKPPRPAAGSSQTPTDTAALGPQRDARPASLVDLFPTVCDMAGLQGRLPPHHGASLLRRPATPRPVYGELTTTWYMQRPSSGERWVESERWLSLRDGALHAVGVETRETKKPQRRDEWRLFDLAADTREQSPLEPPRPEAPPDGDGASKPRLDEFRKRLAEWEQRQRETAALLGQRIEADLTPAEVERLKEMGYLN